MATYAILIKYTRAGNQAIKEAPDRTERSIQMGPELGVEVKDMYWLMGRYDALLIVEAPNDVVASRVALLGASQGNGVTDTMRAVSMVRGREEHTMRSTPPSRASRAASRRACSRPSGSRRASGERPM